MQALRSRTVQAGAVCSGVAYADVFSAVAIQLQATSVNAAHIGWTCQRKWLSRVHASIQAPTILVPAAAVKPVSNRSQQQHSTLAAHCRQHPQHPNQAVLSSSHTMLIPASPVCCCCLPACCCLLPAEQGCQQGPRYPGHGRVQRHLRQASGEHRP
jgi:hypothetical protein